MKILLVMDPGIVIPVKGYGGIERIIEILALEYRAMGHEVDLLVTDGSFVNGCTVHGIGREGFPPKKWDARKAVPAAWKFLWTHRNGYDLVHSFGRLVYMLPILNHPVKKIMSYQREITRRNIDLINALPQKNMFFTGCSQDLVSRAKVKGNWEAIYNGCNFNRYELAESLPQDAPLIFLGRIERIKGCHTAIQVAKATGNRLVIAGNISGLPEERAYYEKEIQPFIDGSQICHIGTVNDAQKNEWLGRAKALLFPIEWNEPFGIVMVEAMACGTPVIAFQRGAVGEVVDEGITGFKVETVGEMEAAVTRVIKLDRRSCREHARKRFHSQVIAGNYLRLVAGSRKKILILSTHQPAANPRAVKEYEALKEAGFAVNYLYAYNYNWSRQVDERRFRQGLLPRQDFMEVAGNPHQAPVRYFLFRVLYRIFRLLSFAHPFCRHMSISRAAFALLWAAKRHPADLYIAHYLGALPAARRAAEKHGGRLVFDAEDFHRGEQSYYRGQVKNVVAVENELLPLADAITTASPLITEAYQKLYPGQSITTINNVFQKRFRQPLVPQMGTLRLFWFSQNIGRYRGLEIFIRALNELPDADISLTILGNRRSKAYEKELLALADRPARITFRNAVSPEEIFSIAAAHDVGLAGEMPACLNKEICLSNKIFAYLLSGNCILASDMRGQKEFLEQNPGIGFLYRHDDPKDLARKIERLYNDRNLLEACREAASRCSAESSNWETEKITWLALVNGLLNRKSRFSRSDKASTMSWASMPCLPE